MPNRTIATRAARRGRGLEVSLAAEAGFDEGDVDEADDLAISDAGPPQGAGSQGHGTQDGQDGHDQPGGRGKGGSTRSGIVFESGPSLGQADSRSYNDSIVSAVLPALAADGSSSLFRQCALLVVGVAEPTITSGELLGHVRATLIEAVNSGALVPKVGASAPDQNCLLPLLLMRALRPMPAALRLQAHVRAGVMLSMTEWARAARARVPGPISPP